MTKLLAWLRIPAEIAFLLAVVPVLLPALAAALFALDGLAGFRRKKRPPAARGVAGGGATVVIPTWNGKEHLQRNLPSVVEAAAAHPHHEILVVDNASDDGTVEFLGREFPSVRVLEMGRNLGFGGAANAGVSAAANEIVVLLNNDMRVEPGFLQPLVDGFRDARIFSVTAQIFFSDPGKRREETGLVMGRWVNGAIHLTHVVDDAVTELFPTFYGGGGSTAYDKRKFLELGGFDELLTPFYVEDVDIGYMAWKRGWINMYAPDSVVYHEHRGTIGKHFSEAYISAVVHKNRLLFVWKNIHEKRRLLEHFFWLYAGLWADLLLGPAPQRPSCGGFRLALRRLPLLLRRRAAARGPAEIGDTEAFCRPLGGYFRDRYHRFEAKPAAELNVLLAAPYPIHPPLHGGGVFINQTVERLARACRLHLFCLLERESERADNARFARRCASAELMLRRPARNDSATALLPFAAQHFWSPDILWKLHRAIFMKRIDVVQLEYAQLAAYAGNFRQIATFLFEHDIYFQAVRRAAASDGFAAGVRAAYEYLRALRFELSSLAAFDAVQVCTEEQRRFLRSYLGGRPPILTGLRAGIDVRRYAYRASDREPGTMLFVGNLRHEPNRQALDYFLQRIYPAIRRALPSVRLIIAGAEGPPAFVRTLERPGVEYLGKVDDIRSVLSRYAVFVAPILTGSGVRVKLMEAFAAGIPAVATSLGAEGLQDADMDLLEIADRPADFARAAVRLLQDRPYAEQLAYNARQAIARHWDYAAITPRLAERYRAVFEAKLLSRPASPLPLE